MTAATHAGSGPAAFLDIVPPRSARQRLAWRDLREAMALWRLCWTLAWLDIKLRYRGSLLGPLWLTLSTAVMIGAMGAIYSRLFHMNLHKYLPFLALSIVLWGFLSTLVTDACGCFTSADGMIRSARMPFCLHAGRMVLRNVWVLGHNLIVIVAVFGILRIAPGWTALAAVPGFVLWLLDALAAGLLFGALCARFRDIPPIVGSVIQIAFFVTPVIWSPELLGPDRQALLPLNPFNAVLEIVRAPLMGQIPVLADYVSAVAYSCALLLASWLLFARVRGRIAFWV